MSAPTSGTADHSPPSGFYPDPSIPGYIRYWSGTAWVPGTSRPAPAEGEPMPAPPASAVSAALPALAGPVPPSPTAQRAVHQAAPQTAPQAVHQAAPQTAPQAAPRAEVPRVETPRAAEAVRIEETGPVFLDEDPALSEPARPEPVAPLWTEESVDDLAGLARQGALNPRPKPHGAAPGGPPAPLAGHPAPEPEQAPLPVPRRESPPPARVTPQPVGWAQQVHQLADGLAPWQQSPEDPFRQTAAARAPRRPAPFGRRLVARLLDTMILGGVVGAVAAPLWAKSVEHVDEKIAQARQSGETVTVWLIDGTTGTYLAIVLAVLLVGGVLYEALPTALWGRTLGKRACGVRVLDVESQDRVPFGRALRRWLLYALTGVLGVGLFGVLNCAFDRPWRQCWHDKAARTFVAG
ncbi:RDD family protein [Streptomyces sp. NPDC049577]|uniref:RDD family protein n=1 Tax=Streptomyces sp. NPDC049577 TaxID=3155153 RepID=UPI0034135E5D